MKIGKYDITLSRQPAPKQVGTEQGSSGSPASGYFDLEGSLGRIKNPNISQIMEMLDNDGTAQALYNIMTFPVMASDWHIEPDPADIVKSKDADGNEIETHPQADFVEDALRNPEHKGGMSTPFSLVIADLLMAVAQGYRFFEIVYKLNDAGQIVFKKVVAREASEIDIQTDETGGFAGVKQKVKRGNESITVLIELPYCFLYTYRKERNKLKGASAFRAGFYHYDKKHRLYFLQNQQAQVNAMAFKVLDSPDGATKEARDENLAAVDKMAVRPSIALPFGWKLNIAQPARGMDLSPYVDHQDVQMARAVLAQGMLLGNQTGSSGGSYALSESHMDMFMLGEMALITTIEEHITSFLISKLIDYNFDQPLYPVFRFNPLNDDVSTLLQEGFKSLIAKGAVPKWVANGISEKVAERVQIEKPEDEGVEADDNDYIGITNTPANPALTRKHEHSKKKVGRFSNDDWWRELTAAEAKVQFAKIQKQADDEEQSLLDDLKPIFDKLASDTADRLEPLLQGDDPVGAMDGFTLSFQDEVVKVFNDHMIAMYSDSKKQAADEINKKAPANKPASKTLIQQHAQSIADKQYSDMLFNLKGIVTDAVRKNLLARQQLSWKDILGTAVDMFATFYADKEELTASSLITLALNIGRDDVFQEYSDDVYGYQYSAILDDVVCPICEELDGSVATPDEYYNTIWMPPIHFNCRCIWVAIMNDEEDKPDYTGIPSTPGGADAPSLSYKHNGVHYDIFLSKESAKLWQQKRR